MNWNVVGRSCLIGYRGLLSYCRFLSCNICLSVHTYIHTELQQILKYICTSRNTVYNKTIKGKTPILSVKWLFTFLVTCL